MVPRSIDVCVLAATLCHEMMSHFRSRVRLRSVDGTFDGTIAVKNLPILVRDEAAYTMQQLLLETLEWEADKHEN